MIRNRVFSQLVCGALLVGILGACKSQKETPQSENAPAAAPTSSASKTPPKPSQPAGGIPAPADVAKPPANAETTASGLASKVLKPGEGGDKPTADDRVTVHYTGWTTDGKMFDSSVQRGEPTTFSLRGVIPGWTEGVQLMTKGEKRRFWIPGNLAYGEKPMRPGAPAGQLTFDIELLDIKSAPKAPESVQAPPADAKKTKSGLAYKVLKKGTGTKHPEPNSRVEVHYTGWTTDGKMFDSSVMRDRPTTLGLDRVIEGWKEGIPLMVEGEKTLFWIPEDLAYKGKRPPKGMLVFEVELIKIH